jgi:hypothetical protein
VDAAPVARVANEALAIGIIAAVPMVRGGVLRKT